jgi:hypothetical protein
LFKAGLFLNLPLITIIITLEFSLTDSFQSSQSISPRLRQKLQMGKSSAERMGGPHTGRASTYSVLLRPKEEGVFSGGWNNDTLAIPEIHKYQESQTRHGGRSVDFLYTR